MPMKKLLNVTALIEAGAGVALLALPSLATKWLLGSPFEAPAAVTLVRLAGVALFTLGAACWRASGDTKTRAARGLSGAMLLYNLGVTVILGLAGWHAATVGVLLWPAVVVHIVMTGWCVTSLLRKPAFGSSGNR